MPNIMTTLDRATAWMREHPEEVDNITGLYLSPFSCGITLNMDALKRVLAGENVERSYQSGYVHYRFHKDGLELRSLEKATYPEPDTVTL